MELDHRYKFEQLNKEILREYDVRGIVDDNLSTDTAYTLGRCFGYIINLKKSKKNNIVVGYDGRLTSEKLHKAVCTGLLESGVNVISIGLGPTPKTYFAHHYLDSTAGLMITGSHNPSEYNGFKMVLNKKSFYGEDIQQLYSVSKMNLPHIKNGNLIYKNINDEYINRNIQNFKINKKLKIAWDLGNGAVGEVFDNLISKISPAEHIIINKEVDGNFPNHHPDPTVPKNLIQIQNSVISNNCDIGFAFDGDGDRLGVIDNKGEIIWADQYMIILSKEIASLYKNPKIIMDVKCSKIFFEEIKKFGCDPVMYKTGHSPIKEKMKELNSPLSGEMSGHVCYSDDFFGYDDAIYVALRLLKILSCSDITINEMIAKFPKLISTPEIRFDVEESKKFQIIEEIKERLKNFDGKIIDIDGIRAENSKGWFLIRASNTQNQLTCRLEASNKEDLIYLSNIIETQLKHSNVNYKFNL